MKKIILSILMIFAVFCANAQCVPGAVSLPQAGYIIPDSATNLANGCAGENYEQIIYIKVPADTTFGTVNATIDSFVIEASISGLPSGLTVASIPALLSSPTSRLLVPGNSLACIKISGIIPASTPPGPINLVIPARAYLKIAGIIPIDTSINVNYYHINISPAPCWPTAIQNVNRFDFNLIGNIPNPASTQTQIAFESHVSGSYTLKIVNAVGETMITKKVTASKGMNYIPVNTSTMSSGIYLYSLSDGKNIVSKRMEINN